MQSEAESTLVADKFREIVTITCAKQYTTPTHNARMTKADSVSSPVWRVLSQWSNISNTGQTTHVNKTNATATCNILDHMHAIISPLTDLKICKV